jgi:hypothetical protein
VRRARALRIDAIALAALLAGVAQEGTTSPSGLTWRFRVSINGFVLSAVSRDEQLIELQAKFATLTAANEKLTGEREEYRKLYLETLELCRKLELGASSVRRASVSHRPTRSSRWSLLGTLLGDRARGTAAPPAAPAVEPGRGTSPPAKVREERAQPAGRDRGAAGANARAAHRAGAGRPGTACRHGGAALAGPPAAASSRAGLTFVSGGPRERRGALL